MSHTRNSSPLSFPSGVSLPELLSAVIPSGCLTPGIPPPPPFPRVSHSRNSSLPSFHPGVSLPKFLSAAIPSRCLTPGILSSRRSTFFFILRAFYLGSKITFLIKLCCHFHFWQAIFHTSSVLKRKCFEISKESNFVILNKWNLRIWSMQK